MAAGRSRNCLLHKESMDARNPPMRVGELRSLRDREALFGRVVSAQ